jgi:hypothetical protein
MWPRSYRFRGAGIPLHGWDLVTVCASLPATIAPSKIARFVAANTSRFTITAHPATTQVLRQGQVGVQPAALPPSRLSPATGQPRPWATISGRHVSVLWRIWPNETSAICRARHGLRLRASQQRCGLRPTMVSHFAPAWWRDCGWPQVNQQPQEPAAGSVQR